MATISLRGNDAKAFLEAWRDVHVADPRRVICTRLGCGAQEGERCKNLSTGKRSKTYHAERHKLERRARALVILRQHGALSAAGFAGEMWPFCNPRASARNAAGFLFTMWEEGLVVCDRKPWGTMWRAKRA